MIALALTLAGPGWATDLGVEGKTFPIHEPDMMELMAERASRIDWEAVARDLARRADETLSDFPMAPLPVATETATHYVDPTYVLDRPILDQNGKELIPAGTRANPLEKIRPVTRLFLFDPRREDQVACLDAALAAWPELIEPLSVGGDIRGMAKKLGRPVFYADRHIVERFGLRATPSLVGVGRGERSTMLAVTEFAPGTCSVAGLREAWYGLPFKTEKGALESTTPDGPASK